MRSWRFAGELCWSRWDGRCGLHILPSCFLVAEEVEISQGLCWKEEGVEQRLRLQGAEHRERGWDGVEREQQGEELVGCLFPSPHCSGHAVKSQSTAALREGQSTWGLKALGLENLKPRLPHSSC